MDKRTRRVKGNSTPPPDDLPIRYWEPDPEVEFQKQADETIDFLLGFTILMIVIVVLMFVWGKFE
jgi:hypothetical protein